MFEGFEPASDKQAQKRFVVSTAASVALYALAGAAVLLFASEAQTVIDTAPVDVSFRPPPPPPKVEPPAPIPKEVKVKRVAAPKPLLTPKEIPVEQPPEADPSQAVAEVAGDGDGSGGDVAPAAPPPPPPPPPPPAKRRDPINLPEDATPPVADSGNIAPEYPAAAREKGLEGHVILKIVVSEKGAVVKIEVMRGEEPFAGAAISAVRTWRYSPALVGGEPTAVFRIIKVPFRLK